MPKKGIAAIVLGVGCILTTSALAQGEGEPEQYLYATYHYCSTGGQFDADAIYESLDLEINEKMLKEGKITSYGWLRHHTGGEWRRLDYFSAPTLPALLEAQEALAAAAEEADKGAIMRRVFAEACPRHDDYIWASRGIGSGSEERGKAGFSVYFICNELKEQRADEIVRDHFAPIYNKYVEEGKLRSWGWIEHWVGGKYRRLLTTTADDHASLLITRNELINELFEEEGMEEVGDEFTEICGSHSDYMWNIVHENTRQ